MAGTGRSFTDALSPGGLEVLGLIGVLKSFIESYRGLYGFIGVYRGLQGLGFKVEVLGLWALGSGFRV